MHLLDKIKYTRVAYRVKQTVNNPQTRMKVVLFEYDYTKLADVNKGVFPGQLETIPGTRVHVHYVVHTDAFKELMQSMFCNMPGFSWFHRNRWEKNGQPNLNRRQVVLMYTPVLEELNSTSTPTLTAIPNYEDYNDMPPLIPLNQNLPVPPAQLNLAPYNLLNTTYYNPNIWAHTPVTPNLLGITQYN